MEKVNYFNGGQIKIRKAGSTEFGGRRIEFGDALVIESGKTAEGRVANIKVGYSFVQKIIEMLDDPEFMAWIQTVKP